jgi:hypothetical protein
MYVYLVQYHIGTNFSVWWNLVTYVVKKYIERGIAFLTSNIYISY